MKRLIFDVSTNVMFVGYIKNERLIDFSIRIALRDHAKYLVDRIDELLKRNKISINKIDEIIIGVGPGSYTGTRIAVTVGKMLSLSKNITLKTVSSLLFMTSGYEGKICSCFDARRGYVFANIHENNKIIFDDIYINLDELKNLEEYKDADTIFVNDRNFLVDPRAIIKNAKVVKDIHGLEPNYLRKTEAENNL